MPDRQDANTSRSDADRQSAGAVETLIERFGGLRPMADKLGVPVSTVQGWKKRGAVPPGREPEIRAAIEKLQLGDADAALEGVFRHDEPAAAPAVAEPAAPEPELEPAPESPASTVAAVAAPVAETAADTPPEPEPAPPAAESEPEPVASVPADSPPADAPQEVPVTASPPPAAPTPAAPMTDNRPADDRPSSQGTGAAVAAAVLAVIGAAVSVTAPMWSSEYLQRSVNIAVIEKRTGDVESAVGAAATQRAALAERLAGAEKILAELEGRAVAAGVLAVRDLRAALSSGAPFALEAAAVRVSGLAGAEEQAMLAALAPYADKGVPTRGDLNERFAWTASTVVGAGLSDMLPTLSRDLPGRVWNWASGVAGAVGSAAGSVDMSGVATALRLSGPAAKAAPEAAAAPVEPVVAPTPAPAPVEAAAAPVDSAAAASPSASAIIGEAAALLGRNDLAGAVTALERLQGPAAEQTAEWLTDARARLTADKAAAALTGRATATTASR